MLSFVFNSTVPFVGKHQFDWVFSYPGAEVATQIASRNFPGYVENRPHLWGFWGTNIGQGIEKRIGRHSSVGARVAILSITPSQFPLQLTRDHRSAARTNQLRYLTTGHPLPFGPPLI